jgi:hypothetical protein
MSALAEGKYDRLPTMAADLVNRRVSLIAVLAPPARGHLVSRRDRCYSPALSLSTLFVLRSHPAEQWRVAVASEMLLGSQTQFGCLTLRCGASAPGGHVYETGENKWM